MFESILLGLAQGVLEWLPVSSEGVVVALMSAFSGTSTTTAIRYALWLHIGTCICAVIVFRYRLYDLLLQLWLVKSPLRNAEIRFLFIATITSFSIGAVILLTIEVMLKQVGVFAMAAVGACMVVTGILQLKRRSNIRRKITHLTITDAIIVGLAQGLAVVPGFSRSGFTVAALVWRGYGFKDCLELSMLMSIPASLGAAMVAAITLDLVFEFQMVVATVVAAGSGFFMMRTLLAFSQRANLGVLVILSGVFMLAAGTLLSV